MARAKSKSSMVLPCSAETRKLGIEKLESSGLDLEDAQVLGMEFLDPGTTKSLSDSFFDVPSLRIKYYDPWKPDQLMRCRPGWPEFYRLRYLKMPNTFAAVADKKLPKYVQEPASGICAYFPKSVAWPELLGNPFEPLILTEGELKAAKACKEGFPTIGLGGVFSFQSVSSVLPFLTEFEKINWARRAVYICYDSDYQANKNICLAINRLAEELLDRGALPYYICLPQLEEGKKTGLDDFLLAEPPSALRALLHEATPLTLAKGLWDLNKQVVYVRDPGMIVHRRSYQKISPDAFKSHAFSKETVMEQLFKPDGTTQLKKVSAAPTWLKWPLRAEADALTYAPGKDQLTEDRDNQTLFNTWRGWGCEPKKGNVQPWLDLVDHLFTGAEASLKQWFMRWCAYPLQYPGCKMYSSMVVHGIKHGTGKSLLGVTLGKIYGRNYTEITQDDLEGDFNEWAENRQFCLGDEITGSNKRQEADKLKKLITQTQLRINTKFIPIYTVPDCLNYLFTSNHPDAFFLEDDDRRFAIHEVVVGPLDEEFYVDYDLWKDTDGPAALFHYLLHYDLGDFNPNAKAPLTLAKERMINDVKSDLGAWVAQLLEAPDTLLRVGQIQLKGDLFTNKMLLELYDPTGKTKVTGQGMGTALKKAGAHQVCGGRPLRVNGLQDRYYVIRNKQLWDVATPAQAIKHLQEVAKLDEPKAKKY